MSNRDDVKAAISWTLGVGGMAALGYWSAVYARDQVWLLVPGLAIILTILALNRVAR